jgi:hypothetical protein
MQHFMPVRTAMAGRATFDARPNASPKDSFWRGMPGGRHSFNAKRSLPTSATCAGSCSRNPATTEKLFLTPKPYHFLSNLIK